MIRDVNDNKLWSQMDLRELRHALAWGESIQEVAHLLGRSGTLGEVKLKAKELGLPTTDNTTPAESSWPDDS
jgi:hypothetical protein